MEDNEINDLAARLETTIPPEDAVVKFLQHGGGPDESHMVANRAGYLRLAALFHRAAVAPPYEKDGSAVVDVDTSDVIDEDSDVTIAWLERQETFVKVEYKPAFWENLLPIGCIVFLGISFALILIGAGTVVDWLS
jgi:hypothetical protein